MNIEVILTQNDPKLGTIGEVVKVAPGFAYNFLIPHGKAKLATPSNLKSLETERARLAKKKVENKSQAEELAGKIEKISLTIEMAAGEEDKLYGAVTAQDIQQALLSKAISLGKKDIHLEEPIKKLGAYQAKVKLHSEVSANLKLLVVKKK